MHTLHIFFKTIEHCNSLMYTLYAILKDHLGGWALQDLQTVVKDLAILQMLKIT